MVKDQLWKIVVILIIVAACALYVYPPHQKLKLGLDLAGGTSLVYEIDTTGLKPQEQRGLAQRMIPILLRRIDPTHVANIVMRPQGDTRIEIQIPLASAEARQRREAYEKALLALEEENINLLRIRQVLNLEPAEREKLFEEFSRGRAERRAVLDELANIYDLRRQKQEQRDMLAAEMDTIRQQLAEAGLDVERLQSYLMQWVKLDSDKRREEIETYVKANVSDETGNGLGEKQTQARNLIDDYIAIYQRWEPIVNELTEPENGLNVQWQNAIRKLQTLNLNIDQLRDILDMPGNSGKRREMIDALKAQFPDRADKIEAVVQAYDAYSSVGGRLDDPEDLKRMIKGAGVLEFRILPTLEDDNAERLAAYVEALREKGPKEASDNRYIWCEIEDPASWPPNLGITATFGDKRYVLASNQPDETMLQQGQRQWRLRRAYPTTDRHGAQAIGFTFDEIGANLFYRLTSTNLGRPLCILLDNRAISAPNIESAIRSQGVITGRFSQTEIEDMVNKLNAGSLPARLSDVPISERTIGATLGADNLQKGIRAGLIGLAVVAIFMLIYYMLAGAIADIALVMNIIIVLGVMALLQSTFTLPGIAGLILTIGMSVDANVLIFERIREEQKRGSSLRSAIANGYSKAFSTIFDANVTTFGVAAILYMAASEEIKGFAIVLMLGILASMFTALFVTRVIFDLLTTSRLLTGPLPMFGLFQNVSVDWMKLRPVFFVISLILVVGGLVIFFTRDETTNSKYDIEFTGGTSVQIDLKEGAGLDRAAVERRFRDYALSIGNMALAAARVNEVGTSGRQFEISTTETNITTARLTFQTEPVPNAETILERIREAARQLGQRLGQLKVTPIEQNVFEVSTSRFNIAAVREVLEAAFKEDENVIIGDPVVHEVVTDAVREAFKDFLAVRENLGIKILREERILPSSDDAAILADYLGGIKLVCELETGTTAADLDARIRDIRFKPDMQDLEWYRYNILDENLQEPDPEQRLTKFVYVSVHPEAGYRELDENEWEHFVNNEKTKLITAASLEESLSRVTQIDPSIGSKAKQQAMVAILLSLVGIIGYIWIRFGTPRFGVAAIVALIHDVCIALGAVTGCTYLAGTPLGNALLIGDFKINLEIIAAFLTLIGYSLNDTIVVFDRIRENRGKSSILTPQLINNSINQTLSRTLLTSMTTFIVVLIMYIWGGEGLRGFTFAMLIGILVGTYSSIAIAAPLLLIGAPKEDKK